MEMSDPYRAPQSDIEIKSSVDVFDDSNVLSPRGRFGRLSYLAWGTLMALISWMITTAVIGTSAMIATVDENPMAIYWQNPMVLITTIASMIVGIIFAVRRFHDINLSGWWSVTVLIPLVNLISTLVLIFAPGKPHANNFGPPRRTRGWEKVLGLLLPIVFFGGIIAAIAVPAYNSYIEAARQAAGAG